MRQLVCLSSTPWDDLHPSRTQRFMQLFPDTEILYFEPVPNYQDRKGTPKKVCERVAPLIYVYSLPSLRPALEEHSLRHTMNMRKLSKFIYSCMEYHQFQDVLFWVCSPMYSSLLDVLPYSALIYDCDRDWSYLPIRWESTLTSRADLVFAASEDLADHLSPCSDHISVVPNGFTFSKYDWRSNAALPCPPDLAAIHGPVFGFVGTIWPDLNLKPVYQALRAHPEWHFVFVGRASKNNRYLDILKTYPNFHLLGPKPPSQISAYISHFTVGTSYLRDSQEFDDILSPRIYEYLAAGIPIVSMFHHGHKEEYPTLVESAYTERQFVLMCEKVLRENSVVKRELRNLRAAEADWSVRYRQVRQLVLDGHLLGQ